MSKLSGEKTDQRLETLSTIWNIPLEKVKVTAQKLIDIGFFEERGVKEDPRFWVPFLYRNELQMIQGSADI
ncbi:MAG TPA: hypothetical protein VMU83_20725 [Hanamia sp.]|nr:hypothetical protein [Hanamia sp.]